MKNPSKPRIIKQHEGLWAWEVDAIAHRDGSRAARSVSRLAWARGVVPAPVGVQTVLAIAVKMARAEQKAFAKEWAKEKRALLKETRAAK